MSEPVITCWSIPFHIDIFFILSLGVFDWHVWIWKSVFRICQWITKSKTKVWHTEIKKFNIRFAVSAFLEIRKNVCCCREQCSMIRQFCARHLTENLWNHDSKQHSALKVEFPIHCGHLKTENSKWLRSAYFWETSAYLSMSFVIFGHFSSFLLPGLVILTYVWHYISYLAWFPFLFLSFLL